MNNDEIKILYNELLNDSKFKPQKRGFEFEKLIEAKLENEKLEPRASYKPKGEQVDGSFFWEGQTYLLEAKWVKDKLPASSIYAFKGKLDGKFHSTSGVFLAVNGYNKDVEDALKFGKSLNILLFDRNDISLIFNNKVSFLDVLKFKLREAGDTGSLNVPYELKKRAKNISETQSVKYINIASFSKKYNKQTKSEDLLIFVEGQNDVPLIDNLLKPLESDFSLSYKIVVLEGSRNIRQLPALLNLYAKYHQTKALIVFLDDDQATLQMKSVIENTIDQLENSSIPIDTKFFFLKDDLKNELKNTDRIISKEDLKHFTKSQLYIELNNFILNITEEYYDPEVDIPLDAFNAVMDRAEWNYEKSEITFSEDVQYDTVIDNIEDLVEYLNEAMVSEMQGRMPLYWLKEQDSLDYDTEAREYLHKYLYDELEKLKWDIDAL
ncbi:hypothetical protein QWY81_08720 [Polaribacter undariae]|uniref:Restriction endonuclease type IV Mrr domain-containing protein n=1 Tax=Polaribacter sejongensis TaxID=985043 RepID=A0AAJ1QWW2_9FLAO|nr:restriction endonuclease [Polaribacter undariae]MDN3619532.1 hypothetical protein [Polaribacter undariae]UWD32353.1 hypothetical protein NQP51_01490 [Polaribacter undariae]